MLSFVESLLNIRKVLIQATPFVLGILLLNLSPFINTVVTTQLSPGALAFVGTVHLILFFAETFVNALSYAVQIYTARFDNTRSQNNILFSAFIITLTFNWLLWTIVLHFGQPLLSSIIFNIKLQPEHFAYFRLQTCTFFCNSLILLLRGYFAGKKRNDLFFSVIAIIVGSQVLFNIAMSSYSQYFYTILSVGCAELLAKILGLCFYLNIFINSFLSERNKTPRISGRHIQQLLTFIAPLYAFGILDHYATVMLYQLAGLTLSSQGFSSLVLVFSVLGCFPGMGFGLAAMTPVSRSFGKKAFREAYKTILYFTLTGSWFIFTLSLLLCLNLPVLLSYLTHDISLMRISLLPMQIMLFTSGIHVACQVSIRSLQAVDQTRLSTYINLVIVYGCRMLMLFAYYQGMQVHIYHFFLALMFEKILKLLWMQSYLYYYLHKLSRKPSNIYFSKATPQDAQQLD